MDQILSALPKTGVAETGVAATSAAADTLWTPVGRVEDIPVRGSRVIRTPDGDVALFRTADDAVFALRDRCPHKNGPLSQGIVHGQRVTCPLHNWVIELSTGEAVAPDVGNAGHIPVRVEDGAVSVALELATAARGGCKGACHV
ncbi:nitrite reductase small subunit NirD [Azospirillum griseum]|uniref:Nitrite reductase small subunit NirD n=1 Tax=Azospirillum griseum TaxID=2496639 RepID=A0A3S0IDU5_9PROT|nr:nitrite reductase small subunit NirD [Azospirillum griseum]